MKAVAVVHGSGSMTAPVESFKLSKDPEKAKENDEDELVHANTSFRLLSELGTAGDFFVQ